MYLKIILIYNILLCVKKYNILFIMLFILLYIMYKFVLFINKNNYDTNIVMLFIYKYCI